MSTQRELDKIRVAFNKVKTDNLYLSQKINDLERSQNELLKFVMGQKKPTASKSEEKIYIGNKTSMKIHISDCPYAKKITADNREIFDSLNSALKKKYIRCTCVAR